MACIVLLLIPVCLVAQPTWKRTTEIDTQTTSLFRSSRTANLPTTATLQTGDFMYEISHRFNSVNSGSDGLYGLDGPATIRTALSYGLADILMVTLGRTNIQDNLEICFKVKLNSSAFLGSQQSLALLAGTAFNTEVFAGLKKRSAFAAESIQYYGQLVLNSVLMDKSLGLGMVPSVVYNSFIFSSDYSAAKKYTFSLPLYAQFYLNRMWSVFVEYSPVLGGWKGNLYYDAGSENRSHNTLAGGVAIDTGGHQFFLFITNSERLNASQYLTGSSAGVPKKSAWRLAFGITRIL